MLDIAKTIVAENPADVDALLNVKLAGSDRTVQEDLQDKVLAIGENLKIRRFVRHEGIVSTYVHMGGSVGVMVFFDTDEATAAKPEFKVMGKDVAMQIAAMSPLYLCRDEVPADVIKHEKSINLAQIKEDPKMASKPEKVIEGIINGKIAKFCKENCLLEQQFVKDGDINVAKYIDNAAKELGVSIKATGFVRYAKGEGLQKKEENYAEEIAKMTGK